MSLRRPQTGINQVVDVKTLWELRADYWKRVILGPAYDVVPGETEQRGKEVRIRAHTRS